MLKPVLTLGLLLSLSTAAAGPWRDALKPYEVRDNTLCTALKKFAGGPQTYTPYRVSKTPFFIVKSVVDSAFFLDNYKPIGDTVDKGQGFYTNNQGREEATTHIIHFDTVDRYTTDICVIELKPGG